MGLWLTYVSINEVLFRGYYFDATATKNWKFQNFYQFLACEKLANIFIHSSVTQHIDKQDHVPNTIAHLMVYIDPLWK